MKRSRIFVKTMALLLCALLLCVLPSCNSLRGADGLSAYELAVKAGFEGSWNLCRGRRVPAVSKAPRASKASKVLRAYRASKVPKVSRVLRVSKASKVNRVSRAHRAFKVSRAWVLKSLRSSTVS